MNTNLALDFCPELEFRIWMVGDIDLRLWKLGGLAIPPFISVRYYLSKHEIGLSVSFYLYITICRTRLQWYCACKIKQTRHENWYRGTYENIKVFSVTSTFFNYLALKCCHHGLSFCCSELWFLRHPKTSPGYIRTHLICFGVIWS